MYDLGVIGLRISGLGWFRVQGVRFRGILGLRISGLGWFRVQGVRFRGYRA